MLSSSSTNHADIKEKDEHTAAADLARGRYPALADYVEGFQPRPRGELSRPPAVVHSSQYRYIYSELHGQYSYM